MTNQSMAVHESVECNGVNVTALFETIDAVKANPEIAQFQFRARNRWMGGDHNSLPVDVMIETY